MISSAQLRAARSMIGWTQSELAKAAGVSVPTIKRAESDVGITASDQSISAIRGALEAAGIEFIEQNGGGPGVRARQ